MRKKLLAIGLSLLSINAAWARQIESCHAREATAGPTIPNDCKTEVKPMLTTAWGQMSPYNSACPILTSKDGKQQRAKVGCVACAMGQIMYFHQYPLKGNDSKTYGLTTKLSANFGNTTYEWEKIRTSYVGNETDEEEQAVSTLLFHCGVAASMNYGIYISYVLNNSIIAKALTHYFNYNSESVRYLKKDDYDTEEWLNLVYREISNGRPVLYCGKSKTLGAHAFVLDGYRKDGAVHINWGWYGNKNGYYDLELNLPGTDFNQGQAMVVGIKRPRGESTSIKRNEIKEASKTIIGEFNVMGMPMKSNDRGLHLIRYSDGSSKKIVK